MHSKWGKNTVIKCSQTGGPQNKFGPLDKLCLVLKKHSFKSSLVVMIDKV